MDEIPAPVSTPSVAKANDGSKRIRAWAIWLTVGALGVGAFALRSRGTDNAPQTRSDAAHAQAATQPLPKFIDLGSDRCRSCQAMIPVTDGAGVRAVAVPFTVPSPQCLSQCLQQFGGRQAPAELAPEQLLECLP